MIWLYHNLTISTFEFCIYIILITLGEYVWEKYWEKLSFGVYFSVIDSQNYYVPKVLWVFLKYLIYSERVALYV